MFDTTLERNTDFVEVDPEPPADFLLALTEAAMAESESGREERAVLLPGLDSSLPSAYLAAVVSALSPRELSGHDQIVLLKAEQRLSRTIRRGLMRRWLRSMR